MTTISFDNALGIHDDALRLRSQRSEVLANNLANADTPGYKARDVDFQAALQQAQGQQEGMTMAASDAAHMSADGAGGGSPELMYRNPIQPSIDGNTVDTQTEMSKYMRNSMEFQASFQFLNSSIKGLKDALAGQ
ncbi:flagellar basal body rod protein FlgB [Salicola sp. Rm-C-2C1-2]|uniref:flagellar basal body rod protein FlgB n=1 Tax=Salicola sp. Rm-C-2C1-2 TaxID=3141321 RepID=UPI0032E400B7